jgi:hypothetical protein
MPENSLKMDEQIEEQLKTFYHERLVPIAETSQQFFPMGPDSAVQSYYADRADDGNYIHEINAADMEGELRKMWSDDSPQLAEIAAELMRMAELLQEKEETSEEVSPFVYAMF